MFVFVYVERTSFVDQPNVTYMYHARSLERGTHVNRLQQPKESQTHDNQPMNTRKKRLDCKKNISKKLFTHLIDRLE